MLARYQKRRRTLLRRVFESDEDVPVSDDSLSDHNVTSSGNDEFQQHENEAEDNEPILHQNIESSSDNNSSLVLDDSDDQINVHSDLDAPLTSDSDNALSSDDDLSFNEKLADWASSTHQTRDAVNALLLILRQSGHDLPKDTRTLLQTPRNLNVLEKCGGQYIYFGLEDFFNRHIKYLDEQNNLFQLDINVDGLPIAKSSGKQFWPILAKLRCKTKLFPQIIALFLGQAKPHPLEDFLGDFVRDASEKLANGFTKDGVHYVVEFRAFICDAPARAYIKCVISHNAYYGCERCVVRGDWNGRVVFLAAGDSRTNIDFRNNSYTVHKIAVSPLEQLGIDMISCFVLDYMHLVCLGTVRRLLRSLTSGDRHIRIGALQILQISDRLTSFVPFIPSEFARRPRPLSQLDRWKATECRQFLLYTGIVAFKGILHRRYYDHFVTLAVAISLLCRNNSRAEVIYAKELLALFVVEARHLYGDKFLTYNSHSLLHLADDVEYFDCSLDDISAFSFENYLGMIKKLVKNFTNPIVSVVRRLKEKERNSQYKKPKDYSTLILKPTERDCVILLKTGRYALIEAVVGREMFDCKVMKQTSMSDFFLRPCESSKLSIYMCTNYERAQFDRKLVAKCDIKCKGICLPTSEGKVFLPLCHTEL